MTAEPAEPMLLGNTMDRPLLVSSLISYAARSHAGTDVVSVDSAGVTTRSTWGKVAERARLVSGALVADGIRPGERVATIACNDHRHLEAYYGITGIGAVLHTVNPRLHDDQLAFILNDAADSIVLVDQSFTEIAARLAPRTPTVRRWVVLGRLDAPAGLPGEIAYDDWIAAAPGPAAWPDFDERAAATLCYTSGTTGNPKGVLQSHRSIVLQTWATCTGDGHDVHSGHAVLGTVPMFHVNGWALPFATAMSGAKLVLPGPDLSPEALVNLIEAEDITFSAGVPTIWLGVVQYLQGTASSAATAMPSATARRRPAASCTASSCAWSTPTAASCPMTGAASARFRHAVRGCAARTTSANSPTPEHSPTRTCRSPTAAGCARVMWARSTPRAT